MIATQPVAGEHAATVTEAKKAILGKDDFFKLLLAQLKHQNPLSPMDGTEFAVQLAEFSSLEQLTNIGTEIKALGERQDRFQLAGLAGIVGKEITANASAGKGADGTGEKITGKVTGVRWENNDAFLTLEDQEVNFRDVISIR
jgi:flagellar basal-body rod modification protein FlgD